MLAGTAATAPQQGAAGAAGAQQGSGWQHLRAARRARIRANNPCRFGLQQGSQGSQQGAGAGAQQGAGAACAQQGAGAGAQQGAGAGAQQGAGAGAQQGAGAGQHGAGSQQEFFLQQPKMPASAVLAINTMLNTISEQITRFIEMGLLSENR